MPIRFICFHLSIIILALINMLLTVGHDFNQPMPRWRRTLSKVSFTIIPGLTPLFVGIIYKREKVNVDYSKWLGANYTTDLKDKKCPTYICNHTGFMDVPPLLTLTKGDISFLGGEFIKDIPIINRLMVLSESLFVPRAGTPQEKQ